MGITWKGGSEIAAEAFGARDVTEQLDAAQRDALWQLISTAVREGEVLDAKAWREITGMKSERLRAV